MADEPPTKRQRFTSKVVTVKVGTGSDREDFYVHEETLKKHSDFLKAALDKERKEGQSLVIELPEDEAEVFSKYADWLYYGKVDSHLDFSSGDENTVVANANALDMILAKLYIFGERMLNAKFCNAVMRGFVDSAEDFALHSERSAAPACAVVRALYEGTAFGSPIRQFLVDVWVSESICGVSLKKEAELPAQFARDLAWALLGKRRYEDYSRPGELPDERWFKEE